MSIHVKRQTDWTDGKGLITIHVSKEAKTIEREVEKQSRLETDLTQPPLFDKPNKYTNLKRCVCPDHEGDKWVHRSQFCADKRMADGLQSYCKTCDARRKKLAYVPRWKRGTL
jgi:hypothetical protein